MRGSFAALRMTVRGVSGVRRLDLCVWRGWSGPLGPHTLENVGDRELRVIAVEQKDG